MQFVDLKLNLPRPVLELLAKEELKYANRIQEKFRRNAREVDAEIREQLVERMQSGKVEPSADQKRYIGGLEELFGEEEDSKGWKPLGSSREDNKMELKHQQQKKGERSIPLGRAKVVADCSAEEAAAWLFEYCSRQRTAASRKEGDPARLEIRGERRNNEKCFAFVKHFGPFFWNREYLLKFIWTANNDGSFTVAWGSCNENVDYGGSVGKLVRGSAKGFMRARNIQAVGGIPQCQIMFRQYIDTAGYVPTSLVNRYVPYALRPVQEIQDFFKRDEEIDRVAMLSYKRSLAVDTPTSYSAEEELEIANALQFQMKCRGFKKFLDLKSPDTMVKMKGMHLPGDRIATCMASTVIHATAEECAASELALLNSRKLKRRDKEQGIIERIVKKIDNHTLYYKTIRNLGFGLSTKEFRSKVSWFKLKEGKIMILVRDLPQGFEEDQKKQSNGLKTSVYTIWMFEPLQPIGKIPQTAAVFISKVDIGFNSIPKSITNILGPKFLSQVSTLRIKFDKSKEIDTEKLKSIVKNLKKLKDKSIENEESYTSKFEDLEGKEKVESAFPLSEASLKVTGKGKGWGKITIKVFATLEETAAFFWDFESFIHKKMSGDIERSIEKRNRDWEITTRRRQNTDTKSRGRATQVREFRGNMNLHKPNDVTIIITTDPITETKIRRGGISGITIIHEAKEEAAIRLTKRSKNETLVEFVTRLDFGKRVKDQAVRLGIRRHLDEAGQVQQILMHEIKSQDMTKESGEVLGADLVWDGGHIIGGKHLRKDKNLHIENVCKESAALREVVKKYPWFVTLLKKARLGNFAFKKTMHTKLTCVEENEAMVIGSNLMSCLKSTKTARAGVDMWRLQNRAAGELFVEFPWIVGMFYALGEGVVKTAPWGLAFRVLVGGATSTLDFLTTDIHITYIFWKEGKDGYFEASLACLAASFFMQFCVVILQNRQLGAKKLLKECSPILFGLKPALDGYRVASGIVHLSGTTMPQMVELTIIKGVEIFAESIPGTIIQLLAITTTNKEVSFGAWASLVMSSISTGFIGATISYDFDTDPEKREKVPEFYGYVPSKPSKRSVVFGAMTFYTSGMLLIRCMTIVLLSLSGKKFVFAYLIADLGIYLLVKILRGDFWYWLPVGGAWSEFFTSICFRIAVKIITDFTSIAQFRHPNEVGGAYWSFSFALTMASFPVSILICQNHGISTIFATKFAAIVFTWTLAMFILFILNINHDYLHTFYSLERGRDLTVRKWNHVTNEAIRADTVFRTSKHHWEEIEEDVRGWVEVNWHRWQQEKPKWFTEVQSRIPLEYIPSYEGRKYESARRLKKMMFEEDMDKPRGEVK